MTASSTPPTRAACSDSPSTSRAAPRCPTPPSASSGCDRVTTFDTVLIANRGEIACRIIETVHRLGLRAVAVYSEADAGARHVRLADVAVCIGPAAPTASYLNIEALIAAARRTGAQAIHPGYGFLSENVEFARACAAAGITFVGPGERALDIMGDKITSKNHVKASGVPVIPGVDTPGLSDAELVARSGEVGYPLIIKPSAGGGGKGMQVVTEAEGLAAGLAQARRVASSAFGDDTLFLERLVLAPRHIEVQVLADSHGNVVHLFERECSLQRRHQKVVEEAPSALLDAAMRERIGAAACEVARSVEYVGAGTVEFLVSDAAPDEFFFMEMNTRLQVEHPVTEEVTGLDLVEWQLAIAAGASLTGAAGQAALERPDAPRGHSVEVRVYAESPARGFLPTNGTVLRYREPRGAGVRVDSMLTEGLVIGTDYDPMLAKIIATAPTREAALATLRRALGEAVILGVETNLDYLRSLLADPDVVAGKLDTSLIDRRFATATPEPPGLEHVLAAALLRGAGAAETGAGATHGATPSAAAGPWSLRDGFRLGAPAPRTHTIEWLSPTPTGDDTLSWQVTTAPDGATTVAGATDWAGRASLIETAAGEATLTVDGVTHTLDVAVDAAPGAPGLWIHLDGRTVRLGAPSRHDLLARELAQRERGGGHAAPEVNAPMPGTVVLLGVATGDTVNAGDTLVTIEAMKMEHPLAATVSGTVEILVAVGEQVKLGQTVAIVTPAPSDPRPETPGAS
ncbi:ATP-grasp domain-containing protein [Micrococcales bacterium 31B]|nr:ATP-grasp domain-containing protein [Micrococcales bacterium 31B]